MMILKFIRIAVRLKQQKEVAMQAADVARTVLLQGLQLWGQTVDEQVQAWQKAFAFMNLSVVLSVGEDNGRKAFVFDGVDAGKAKGFMAEV